MAIRTRGAARVPAGPAATGVVEEVLRAARNPIFGRGRHSERRAHGRRRSRRIGRPGLVAAFCNETERLFGYEPVPRVRVDARSRFLVVRRFRGEPRMRAVRRRHYRGNSRVVLTSCGQAGRAAGASHSNTHSIGFVAHTASRVNRNIKLDLLGHSLGIPSP